MKWSNKLTKGTTKSLGNKHELDKFYTKPETAKYCLSLLNLSEFDCIIEPSAGSGSFSNQIDNCIAFDLSPENEKIKKADWFKIDKSFAKKYNKVLVVGNPPFGTQGTLAIEFIKESMKFADTIAFILPRSFRKDSIKNRIPLNYSIIKEIDLPDNSFTLNGNNYSVPCVFQIWQKSNKMRSKIIRRIKSQLFEFTNRQKADFRIQRVGGNAGKASNNLTAAESSNYFIKNISNLNNEDFIKLINNIEFATKNYTVGPRSISKGELVEEIEKAYKTNY